MDLANLKDEDSVWFLDTLKGCFKYIGSLSNSYYFEDFKLEYQPTTKKWHTVFYQHTPADIDEKWYNKAIEKIVVKLYTQAMFRGLH